MNLDFQGKKVLIMGLGLHGGGVGTVKFLKNRGARITVTDLHDARILAPAIRQLKNFKSIRYSLGGHRKDDFAEADIIIKNPGVRPDSPYLKIAQKRKIPVTSDINVFFRECPAEIVGVTGTRGKSTTAYLIWKFLKAGFARQKPEPAARRRQVWLAGNIRKSALELLPRIKKRDLVVLELSSFQLQDMASEKKSPHIAVITNLLLDHLNWHKNFREYVRAKSYIFKFQKTRGLLFFNPDDEKVKALAKKAVSKAIPGRLPKVLRPWVDSHLGAHYRSSVGLAVAVARHFKISPAVIKKTVQAFHGLPARQEEVSIVGGVHFIDDTTATTPDAAIAAIKRFRELAGRNKLILIAGGQDKKLDFREMARVIKKYAGALVLLPGDATEKIKKLLFFARSREDTLRRSSSFDKLRINSARTISVYNAAKMHEAVKIAHHLAKRGDYVVLSPGAASFGLFLNEFDRGDQFTRAVKKLKQRVLNSLFLNSARK